MNKIRINITIDPKLKANSTKILEELGLDLSGAISLFLNQVVIHNGLPFDVNKSKDNIYHKYKQLKDLIEEYFGFKGAKYTEVEKTMTKAEIKAAKKEYEDIKAGKIKLQEFKNFAECLKEIGVEI